MDDATLARWLALREQADARARSAALTRGVVVSLTSNERVNALDLATGAGSNLRHLIEALPPRQSWVVVDRSPALLAALVDRTRTWATGRGHRFELTAAGFRLASDRLDCGVDVCQRDLSSLRDTSIFDGRHVVTASALLDLVSASWLRALAARCRSVGAMALLTITYDGRFSIEPPDPGDDQVRELMNHHQRRDKGLGGPAAGPFAADEARRAFESEGYIVEVAQSDWRLGPDDSEMQRMLIDGWLQSAVEMAPGLTDPLAAWHRRRIAHVDAGGSHAVVGHRDIAASLEPFRREPPASSRKP
jgi:hypothetical protein